MVTASGFSRLRLQVLPARRRRGESHGSCTSATVPGALGVLAPARATGRSDSHGPRGTDIDREQSGAWLVYGGRAECAREVHLKPRTSVTLRSWCSAAHSLGSPDPLLDPIRRNPQIPRKLLDGFPSAVAPVDHQSEWPVHCESSRLLCDASIWVQSAGRSLACGGTVGLGPTVRGVSAAGRHLSTGSRRLPQV